MITWVIVFTLTATMAVIFTTTIRKLIPFAIWSPVYTIPTVYLTLGTSGYLYYTFTTDYQGGFYDIGVSSSQIAEGLQAFLVAVSAFLIGVLIYILFSKRLQRVVRRSRYRRSLSNDTLAYSRRTLGLSPLVLAPLAIPIALIVIGEGFENVIWRSQYIVQQYYYVGVVGSLLSMPAVLVLGFLTSSKKSRLWRLMCIGLLAVYCILLLSLSTRRIVVAFLFYILGLSLGGVRKKILVPLMLAWILNLPLLLQVPLELRGMPEQGLLPLPSNLGSVFSQNLFPLYVQMIDTVLRNLAFGVPLAGFVKNAYHIPDGALIVSLNPLPSLVSLPVLPSWSDIQPQLRVTSNIPYNAIGELLHHGWLWLFLYYLGIGIVACWVDVGVRAFENHRIRWGFLVACGLLFYFSISSTQYNLRGATRYVFYAVAIVMLWRLLCKVRLSFR